jgi:hypothetical protein
LPVNNIAIDNPGCQGEQLPGYPVSKSNQTTNFNREFYFNHCFWGRFAPTDFSHIINFMGTMLQTAIPYNPIWLSGLKLACPICGTISEMKATGFTLPQFLFQLIGQS